MMDRCKYKCVTCNRSAKLLLAELVPFTESSAEGILGGDTDRVMSLAMDLVGARADLAEASKELAALKRRQR
jgi:hypothetical protein